MQNVTEVILLHIMTNVSHSKLITAIFISYIRSSDKLSNSIIMSHHQNQNCSPLSLSVCSPAFLVLVNATAHSNNMSTLFRISFNHFHLSKLNLYFFLTQHCSILCIINYIISYPLQLHM